MAHARKTHAILVRLEPELHARLLALRAQRGEPIAAWIRRTIRKALSNPAAEHAGGLAALAAVQAARRGR